MTAQELHAVDDVDVPVHDAATVMVVRDAPDGLEVLVVRRTTKAAFAAGAYVFPGGRVDDTDRDVPVTGRDQAQAERLTGSSRGLAFWAAAARETFEESGVLLADRIGGPGVDEDLEGARRRVHTGEQEFAALLQGMGTRIDASRIPYVARWITPEGEPRRFDTRFFVVGAPDGAEPLHDAAETTEALWLRPGDALERCRVGEISLLPPTMANLSWLAASGTVAEAVDAGFARKVEVVAPHIVREPDGSIILQIGDDRLLLRRGGARD